MTGEEIVIGKLYAVRLKNRPGDPVHRIKAVNKVGRGGKVRVRYLDDPHPGLEEYLHSRQFLCSWGERKAYLRDEERRETLKAVSGRQGNAARHEAVNLILSSTGEPSAGLWTANTLQMPIDEVKQIAARAGLKEPLEQLGAHGYVDRKGELHLSFEGAEELARAFAAAEPETVALYIQTEQDELRAGGWQAGDRYLHKMLLDKAPGYALARQWAGFDQEVKLLRDEIGRLQALVNRAVYELKDAGAERAARRIERGLKGR